MLNDFEIFEKLCIDAGFDVYTKEIDDFFVQVPYHSCRIEGFGIIGVFTDSTYDAYPDLQERLMADNAKCFKHVKDSPLVAKLENYCTKKSFQKLLKQLKHLGSEDGYRICTTHRETDEHPWPKEYNEEGK
jgi:hypothetical protein